MYKVAAPIGGISTGRSDSHHRATYSRNAENSDSYPRVDFLFDGSMATMYEGGEVLKSSSIRDAFRSFRDFSHRPRSVEAWGGLNIEKGWTPGKAGGNMMSDEGINPFET